MEGSRSIVLVRLIVFLATVVTYSAASQDKQIEAYIGDTVHLPCIVDEKQCGQLHSVKWYKDANRVYVMRSAGTSRSEGDTTNRVIELRSLAFGNQINRMAVNYTSETGNALLRISDVEGDDEAIYKCEITYLEVIENCDVVQIVHLKTLKVPDSVKIHLGDGRPIKNLTVLQARMEGDEMNLICEAAGGKPIPQVKWFKGSEEIERADYTTLSSGGGFGTGRSKLDLTLSRSELMANFECKVESDALKQPIVSRVTTDVYVRPINITLNGTEKYVVQGSNVKLECVVTGARPKATIRWMNGTKEIKESDLRTSITGESPLRTKFMDEKYGTIMTVGILEFKATHYENGKTIFCLTHNEVMTNFSEPDMQASKILDVRYPPVVTVSPLQVTVNESTDDKATNVFFQCNGFANPQTLEAAKWMKDGKDLIVTDNKKYIGGDLVNPPLYINNVNRDDMGAYNCSLKNEIGESTSKDTIILNVQYTPSVEIIMDPPTPLKAVDKSDVMLMCNVTAGNPSNLLKVRWYLDGRLMKELPECDYNKEDGGEFCGLEPIFLNLTRVIQTYAGNYTCQGQNDAGWGLVSNPQELVVYYPPTTVNLTYFPSSVSEVVKGANITLNCTVMNPGRPENLTYYWYRASHRMEEYNTSYVVLKSLRVEERSKFTCIAVNDGGESEPASVDIKVNAPPAFITPLQKYQGILYNSNNISLTCRVECFPQCSIIWYKNGMRLNLDQDSLYYVEMKELKADVQKNDFESIESTLIWNLTAWPGNVLDKFSPHSNYTCEATSNGIGKAVHSTIEIAVDFPPEDVKVIPQIVKVKEGEIPGSVTCQGKGHPKLSYEWRKNITAPVNNTTGELSLGKLKRDQSGSYICIAYNKHPPNKTAEVYFDVLFAPECTVTPSERDGNPALVCTANANPQEVTFVWEAIEGNETFSMDSNIQSDGMRSYLILDTSIDVARTYYCKVNNSVGKGEMCETPVDGNVPWWNRFDNERLIIVIAASIAIIIVVIILCILIIMLCRRKRAQTKYNNTLEMEEREKFLYSQSPDVLGLPLVPCSRVTYLGNQAPNPSSTDDKAKLGSAPPFNYRADPMTDGEKQFYENLPFHGMQNPPNKNAFYTLSAPHFKQLATVAPPQYSATIPNQKHATKLLPKSLFQEPLPKSKSFSSKSKQKKHHFQIPLQKCHSFKFQTAESYFQPIKNIHEENLMRNGYVSDYPESSHHQRHGREKHHKREKHKQKTKGPLVLRRPNNYHENVHYPESIQTSVQLQYPQPLLGSSLHECTNAVSPNNGVVYADLDISANSRKSQLPGSSSSSSKAKAQKPQSTEYATLNFNEVRQEIDV